MNYDIKFLSSFYLIKMYKIKKRLIIDELSVVISTQTRYNLVKTRETKRMYYIDNQIFIIFLCLVILPFFTCFLLDSTLLVHLDTQNFLVSLQNKKSSENKRVNDLLGLIHV